MSQEKNNPSPATPHELLTRKAADAPVEVDRCALYHRWVNEYVARQCSDKFNTLNPLHGNPECPCLDEPDIHHCVEAPFPSIAPCIHVTWGDSDCDCIESEDHEVLCVTVCNCYTNVTFSNFEIQIAIVLNADGTPVATLPDGTPSVQLLPIGPLCFGDIGPCKGDKETCVSRQLVMLNCGAKAGKYKIWLAGICFDVVHHYFQNAQFEFVICKD